MEPAVLVFLLVGGIGFAIYLFYSMRSGYREGYQRGQAEAVAKGAAATTAVAMAAALEARKKKKKRRRRRARCLSEPLLPVLLPVLVLAVLAKRGAVGMHTLVALGPSYLVEAAAMRATTRKI